MRRWGAICLTVIMLFAVLQISVVADDMPQEKVIYLTFDDGPSVHTRQLLRILDRYGAKATFFLVDTGLCGEELLQQMVRSGHSIGIHSMSHDFETIYSSDEAYMEDALAMQALVLQRAGITTMLLRFPGGSSNTVSCRYNKGIMSRLIRMVEEAGFTYFDWNVDSRDAAGCRNAEEIYQNVISGIQGKTWAVVLQHDVTSYSVQAVERILIWGKCNGYRFCALNESSPQCHHPVQN